MLQTLSILDALTTSTTIFSAAYGIYAVVSDFHETKRGKRVLSRAGRIGVVMLIISAVLNMAAAYYKKRQQEEVKAADRRASLMPLTDLELAVNLAIPLNQPDLASYGERLRRETESIRAKILKNPDYPPRIQLDERLSAVPVLSSSKKYDGLILSERSLLFPKAPPMEQLSPSSPDLGEARMVNLLKTKFIVALVFYRGDVVQKLMSDETGINPDLDVWVSSPDEFPYPTYEVLKEQMVIEFGDRAEIKRQSERFISLPDLADSTVEISVVTGWFDNLTIYPTIILAAGKTYSMQISIDRCKPLNKTHFVCRISNDKKPVSF